MGNSHFKNRNRLSSHSSKNMNSGLVSTQNNGTFGTVSSSTAQTATRSLSASYLIGSTIHQSLNHPSNGQQQLLHSSHYSNSCPLSFSATVSSTSNNSSTPFQLNSNLTATSTAVAHKTRTSKIIIPYERWIKNECKKWGHFKDFDFYNLIVSSNSAPSTSTQSTLNTTNSNPNNIIITINNLNHNEDSPSSNQQQQQQSNTSFIIQSENLNNNSTLLSSFLSSSSWSNESKNVSNYNIRPLHYVNGHFFKPIERLGDSQFILSQWPLNDVIVTVPCSIERYRSNDKTAKQTAARLNRVVGVCEDFLVFQIWKGNNEVEIFIYEYKSNATTANAHNDSQIQSTNNKIVRKLNRRFNSRTYTCLISPDKNFLLITPDYEFNYSYSHHTQSHAESTIIFNINTFALLHVIPARCDQRFAFDPRYGLPTHPAPRFAEFDNVRGQIYDLALEKVSYLIF